jgi:hypothetical protein
VNLVVGLRRERIDVLAAETDGGSVNAVVRVACSGEIALVLAPPPLAR